MAQIIDNVNTGGDSSPSGITDEMEVINMGEEDKTEPKTLNEMFSDISVERVQELMQNRDLQAKVGLSELAERLRDSNNEGLSLSISAAYQPAFSVLTDKLSKEGWSDTEQRAAYLVARGMLKLK